jgi:glycosyltransferase involved in cell wall biosynthesis
MPSGKATAQITVVMHTYERPDFVEQDIREGRWAGIPLFIADDASSPEVQIKLQTLAVEAGAGFSARSENGGPARAAHHGVEAAGTPYFALCGDDDYLRDFSDFSAAAADLIKDEGVLFVAMPEVRFVVPGHPQSVQFDRRAFDGMTGAELLRELVFGGEMRALQAGTVLRAEEALPLFASSLFRTSEDFILICRLCAQRPEAVVRVPNRGSYMRREHDRSLSNRSNMSVSRVVTNLLALLVGCRLLQTITDTGDDVVLGLLRQRAQVLAKVYGVGLGSLAVLETVLTGKELDLEIQDAPEALEYLVTNHQALPRELVELKAGLANVLLSGPDGSAADRFGRALEAMASDDSDQAEALLVGLKEADLENPAAVSALRARIAWKRGDATATAKHLCSGLVLNPEDTDCLHMLTQVARAAGEDEATARLENRLLALIPPETAEELQLTHTEGIRDLRVAFLVSKGLDQFLDDIIRDLTPYMDARKFVVATKDEISEAMSWADVCWFEWCNDPLVWASRQDLARQKAVICRLHRYEAFTDMPLRVQWDTVDSLVVVAEHLSGIVCEAIPGLAQRTDILHIPNGVDMSRFELLERSPGFDLALIGYLHGRKNPQMALQIMHELVASDPRYRLHVAGKFQDPALELYWSHQVRQLGLADNVIMYEWQSDIAAFLEDKSYILSTSLHESFGYSIAEAMARGIKPVVHNFPHASDMWAQEMLFNSTSEAVAIIRSGQYDSSAYRAFIQEHYSLESQVDQIRSLIESIANSAAGDTLPIPVREVLALEPKMVNAELTFRCPECRAESKLQQQTIGGHPVARGRCPSCSSTVHIDSDVYREALQQYRHQSEASDEAPDTMAIRSIAESWAQHPVWSQIMTVDGINLGMCMEFDLTPHLVRAWHLADSQETAA